MNKGQTQNKLLKINNSETGEKLSAKLARILKSGAGIEKITENTYPGEYMPGADIRTDRWDVALDGLIKGDLIGRREKEAALRKASVEKPEEKPVEKPVEVPQKE